MVSKSIGHPRVPVLDGAGDYVINPETGKRVTREVTDVWRARYRDASGKEHTRHFKLKRDAQAWLDEETAKLVSGTWTAPKNTRITTGEWLDRWLEGYGGRKSTVSQARVHARLIREHFGERPLSSIKPSDVKAWTKQLGETYAKSYVAALHSRLGQILTDAVHDGILARSPISRRTSPGKGTQRPYVATTTQIWAIHDAMPKHARGLVILGAFVGLRRNEAIALRVEDVDFMRGMVTPTIQYGGGELKTEASRNAIPIPQEVALELGRMPAACGSSTIVCNPWGRPMSPTMANALFSAACATVYGLPEGFRIQDLRHYFASMLIAAGLDVKTVQTRLRHTSAKTTLDVYGHLWPDRDESSRAAVAAAFAAREPARRATSP